MHPKAFLPHPSSLKNVSASPKFRRSDFCLTQNIVSANFLRIVQVILSLLESGTGKGEDEASPSRLQLSPKVADGRNMTSSQNCAAVSRKAHRLLHHSTLGLRGIKRKESSAEFFPKVAVLRRNNLPDLKSR